MNTKDEKVIKYFSKLRFQGNNTWFFTKVEDSFSKRERIRQRKVYFLTFYIGIGLHDICSSLFE